MKVFVSCCLLCLGLYACANDPTYAAPPAGLPTTLTLTAAQSPSGSTVNLTWSDDVTGSDALGGGGGYVSDTSYDFDSLNPPTVDEIAFGPTTTSAFAADGNTSPWALLAESTSPESAPDLTEGYSFSAGVFTWASSDPGNFTDEAFAAYTAGSPIDVPEPPTGLEGSIASGAGLGAIVLQTLFRKGRA